MGNIEEVVSLTFYTDGSTAPGNPGPSGYGFYGTDNLEQEYSGYGYIDDLVTNNVAELTAGIRALTLANTFPNLESLDIFSDSKYFIDFVSYVKKWENNNWISSSGNPVANIELWKEIGIEIAKLKDVKLKFNWVRGHSGIYGNEKSDLLADRGRMNKGKVDFLEVTPSRNTPDIVTKVEGEIKVKKPKVTKEILNPLLSGKRWFFFTKGVKQVNVNNLPLYIYTASSYEDTKENNNKNFTKKAVDSHYSVLLTENPIEELDSIRNLYNTRYENDSMPIIGELSTITKSSVWNTIQENKCNFTTIKGDMAVMDDSTVIANLCNPPKRVYVSEELYEYGLTMIRNHFNPVPNTKEIDITDYFFSTAKTKQVVNPDISMGTKLIVIPNVKISDELITDVKLNIGVDCPLRTNLSNLLKQSNEPIKIYLLVLDVTPNSYRIATLITQKNDVGVYYNRDANYRIISIPISKKVKK